MTPALAVERDSQSSWAHATPVVFVVDDDVSVRESLEAMIDFTGLRAETYACAQDFLKRPRAMVSSCLGLELHPFAHRSQAYAKLRRRPGLRHSTAHRFPPRAFSGGLAWRHPVFGHQFLSSCPYNAPRTIWCTRQYVSARARKAGSSSDHVSDA